MLGATGHDRWLTAILAYYQHPHFHDRCRRRVGGCREGVCLLPAPFEIRLFNRHMKVRMSGRCKTPPFSSVYPTRAPLKGTDHRHVWASNVARAPRSLAVLKELYRQERIAVWLRKYYLKKSYVSKICNVELKIAKYMYYHIFINKEITK